MFLNSLVRITSLFLFIIAAFAALQAFALGSVVMGGVATLLAVGAFLASRASDRRAKRIRASADLVEAEAAVQAMTVGNGLSASVSWLKLVVLLVVLGLIAFVMLDIARTAWEAGKAVKSLFSAAISAFCGVCTISFLRLALRVGMAGYLIKLDMFGLSHCMLPPIAWRHVRGLDLEEIEAKGQKYWNLKVGLDAECAASIIVPAWQRWLDLATPRVNAKRKVLTISLALADMAPTSILAAARRAADAARAPRLLDWSHWEDLQFATERAAAQDRSRLAREENKRLFAGIQSMDIQVGVPGPDQVRAIEARLAASFEEMSRASADELKFFETSRQRLGKEMGRLRRWSIGLLVFTVLMVAVHVFFAR